jgi:acetylornithine deacetylase/succinyl-diaminopimelate desuccinylase-like protein
LAFRLRAAGLHFLRLSTRFGVVAILTLLAACGRKKLAQIERDQTRPAPDWLKVPEVRMLYDYVRIDTRASPGEQAGAEYLQRLLDCEGIESEIVCPAPKRCNLLARLPGRRREGALLLLNHIDVVDVYPPGWKEAAPFSGKIKLGYLYGRGAYDMKSLAVAQLLAMVNLKRHGVVPACDLLFLGEASEEHGQQWGSRWLLDHRPDWFAGVGVILNEGGIDESILRDVRFFGLETMQAGLAVLELQADDAGRLNNLIKDFGQRHFHEQAVEPHPQVVFGFNILANHLSSPLTDPLRHLDRVRKDPKELEVLPDRYGAFLEPRAGWSPVFQRPPGPGGKPHALYVVATPPGLSPAPFAKRVVDAAQERGMGVWDSFVGEATSASPYPTPFTELLRKITEVHYPGIPFGPVPIWGAFTTSAVFRNRGFVAYGYSPIPTNIIDQSRMHGSDERIFLRDFVNGVGLYRDVVEEWALNPPEDQKKSPGFPVQ